MKNEKAMSVFVVVGGHSYEGECWDLGGKVFLNREDAEVYGKSLEDGSNDEGYTFGYVLVREVEVG
jgi:hypothetical protein